MTRSPTGLATAAAMVRQLMTDDVSTNGDASTGARNPILRVAPRPADINANGHIFGGWVLAQMDIAGGIVAGQVSEGPCATVAIEAMEFIAPILLRDLISIYGEVTRRGRTSIAIKLDVIATRDRGETEVKVTEGIFTFVALDEHHRPRPLPPAR
jgi:acyl-CoA thioesterase YciA